MKFKKNDVRKIKNATKEELDKLQNEYEALAKNIHGMSPAGLFLIAAAGVAVILYFRNNFLDLVGLAMILYPIYIFIERGAYRKGYFEGYYEMMTKVGTREDHGHSDNANL